MCVLVADAAAELPAVAAVLLEDLLAQLFVVLLAGGAVILCMPCLRAVGGDGIAAMSASY